ncbi:MAG: hypothetical protein ISR85_02365 [Kiritimatiellales bacterium]|nr:hypothetical protein [Kiritimatiellota bacterium]MBL7011758.1 hypothetical protein [Kiritimatiellales bacterium]
MKKRIVFILTSVLLMLAGCKTTEPEKTTPVSWEEQQAYLRKVRDPRVFGLGIYQTPSGVEIRGGGRLHPAQAEALPMLVDEPFRPVVNLHGNFGVQWPVLLDCASSASLMEFNTARKAGALAVGEQRVPKLATRPGDEIPSCLSLIPSLRLGQLFVESPLVYVRLANGPLGPAAREIEEPVLRGVVGWNILQKLEQIQFVYSVGHVVLKTTEAYEPNPALVVAELPLVKYAGVCAVRGTVDGQDGVILIDPAGDFEVAASSGGGVSMLQLGENFSFSNPAVSVLPGEVRIGARLLQNYRVTICPQADKIYFETKPVFSEN